MDPLCQVVQHDRRDVIAINSRKENVRRFFQELLSEARPKFFMADNVPGIMRD